jgi:hypothetical protein
MSVWALMVIVAMFAGLFAMWRGSFLKTPTHLSGTVTFRGTPIKNGIILITPNAPSGSAASTPIVNGAYNMKLPVEPGRYSVGIRDNGAGLPARYALPKASGLTVDVREGMNVLDFAF